MTGIAVVGLGQFGQFSLPSYVQIPDCSLVGLYDLDQEKLNLLAKSYKVTAFLAFAQVLQDTRVSVVVLNTPNYLHYGQVKEALNAGKSVFCEKPLTLRVEEAQELFALAKKKKLGLSTNHPLIFSPIYQTVKQIIAEAKYGKTQKLSWGGAY